MVQGLMLAVNEKNFQGFPFTKWVILPLLLTTPSQVSVVAPAKASVRGRQNIYTVVQPRRARPPL
jgi:hypothetical protein